MDFQENHKGLTLTVDKEEQQRLGQLHKELGDHFHSDRAYMNWFENFIANSEFYWSCGEIPLTSCPCLVRRDEDYNITEAFGFMDYQVRSILQDLQEYGKVFFIRG